MRNSINVMIVVGALALSACASNGSTKQEVNQKTNNQQVTGLAAQNLVAGECGVFLWTTNRQPEFVFFQKQDESAAKFYREDKTIALSTTDNTSQLGEARTLNLSYSSPENGAVELSGGYSSEIEGGRKIAPATLKLQNAEGWQEIIPVSGVFACL